MKVYKTISQIEDKNGNVIRLKNFTDCKSQKIYKVEYIEYNKAPAAVGSFAPVVSRCYGN